ncbi:hypothetical protein BD779DRAFT_1545377 [Infundibulicybe gibba]|nr:hypothetical protein BD779DRAFT_1545377 [Infundibulicybe gibba]
MRGATLALLFWDRLVFSGSRDKYAAGRASHVSYAICIRLLYLGWRDPEGRGWRDETSVDLDEADVRRSRHPTPDASEQELASPGSARAHPRCGWRPKRRTRFVSYSTGRYVFGA